MKKIFILTAIFFSILRYGFFVPPVSAHILATDGSIGAVLHIDPDDSPIAKQPTGLFFEFKDKQNKFQPDKCNCTLYVYEDGKMIYYDSLTANTPNPTLGNISYFYTFPEKNVYQIVVSGMPQTAGDFQSFSLKYDVRSAQEATQVNAGPATGQTTQNWFSYHLIHIIGIIMVSLFLIGALIWQSAKKKVG